MEQNKKITPLFFFLSVALIATLIAITSSFISLSFELLNRLFPDMISGSYQYGYSYANSSIQGPLSLLIILTPIFFIAIHYWKKVFSLQQSGHNKTLHKWLLYIILFFCAALVIVDSIVLVRYFVSGEITIRFILKVLLIGIVALLIGTYFIRMLRNIRLYSKGFAAAVVILILAAVSGSFALMGSPSTQRALRFDERRVGDLQTIQAELFNYWQRSRALPASLAELENPNTGFTVPKDPKSTNAYEYRSSDALSFELCAFFDRPQQKTFVPADVATPSYSRGFDGNYFWQHGAGRTCFERTIDPNLYPPFNAR